MSRAEGSGDNSFDEIPLARRSMPSRRVSSKKFKFVVLGFIFLTLFSVFITVNLSFNEKLLLSFNKKGLISRISKDALLLGHFPYPEASKKNLVSVYEGLKVHNDTYSALVKMRNAAASDGIRLVLLSGFRSIDLQREIFYENKSVRNQIAIERAKVSAPPGYSEHSTGYAIDLGDGTMRQTDFEVEFEKTPAFLWLKKNAAKYHFVLSFPKGNPQGVSYEPWHWRFEGTVDALKLFESANKMMRLEKTPKGSN